MLTHFLCNMVAQHNEKELCTFTPSKLHRWHEITVTSHQDDNLDLLFQRQRRDVQTDTHIDPLLMDVGEEVVRRNRHMPRVTGQLMGI